MKALAFVVVACLLGCGSSGAGNGDDEPFSTVDSRCTALCRSDEASCSADVTQCEQECQLRVQDMKSLCATCLLEDSNGGTCGGDGEICCPDANFPNSPLDCKDACTDSSGDNPSHNPLCTDLCATSEPTCTDEASACVDQCEARIDGVSGLCALCLLEDANGGSCSDGQVCCPSPEFPTSVETCADVCN